jgi:hypothetical protein
MEETELRKKIKDIHLSKTLTAKEKATQVQVRRSFSKQLTFMHNIATNESWPLSKARRNKRQPLHKDILCMYLQKTDSYSFVLE